MLVDILSTLGTSFFAFMVALADLGVLILPYLIVMSLIGEVLYRVTRKKALAKRYGQQKTYVYYSKKKR